MFWYKLIASLALLYLHLIPNALLSKHHPIVTCNPETILEKQWLCSPKHYSAASTPFFLFNKSVCVSPLISAKFMAIYAHCFPVKTVFQIATQKHTQERFSVRVCTLTHVHTHLMHAHFVRCDSSCPCWPVSELMAN